MRRLPTVLAVATALAGAPVGPVSAAVPSSTSLTVEGSAPALVATYGQPLATVAQVSVPGASPDGWVFFVVDGVSRRADVAADGTASTTVEGLRVGMHDMSATFVPRDPAQQDGSSSAVTVVDVQQAVATPAVAVSGRRAGRTTAVRVRLQTPYGTEPTGKVRFVLRRASSTVRRTGVVLEDGVARLVPGRLAAGRYRAVVTYGGDGNHAGSRAVERFRVRR